MGRSGDSREAVPTGVVAEFGGVECAEGRRVYQLAMGMMHCDGTYPSPTAINLALGRFKRRTNNLNGPETRARRRALLDAGYVLDMRTGRYVPDA